MKYTLLRTLGFGLGITLLASLSAFGQATLNPGGDNPAAPGTLTPGGTVVTTTGSSPFSFNASTGTILGTYDVTVYADPSNVYCTGCYDFVLTVTSSASSTADIEHITDGSFDTSQVTVGTSGSGDLPNNESRTTSGKTVSFDFLGSANILPGASSANLVIETSSKSVSPGSLVITDSLGGTFSGFGDLSTAPEPITTGLLGCGLALLGVASWRKSRKA